MMGRCLHDPSFCRSQLQTNDSIAISVALWALGFEEADTAIDAMMDLIDHGTKNQKLTASFYNENLFYEKLKFQAARKAILEYTDDLELVAAFMPAFTAPLSGYTYKLLYDEGSSRNELVKPKVAILTDYFEDRADAQRHYEKFFDIYERLPKKGVVFEPCIFPWHRVCNGQR